MKRIYFKGLIVLFSVLFIAALGVVFSLRVDADITCPDHRREQYCVYYAKADKALYQSERKFEIVATGNTIRFRALTDNLKNVTFKPLDFASTRFLHPALNTLQCGSVPTIYGGHPVDHDNFKVKNSVYELKINPKWPDDTHLSQKFQLMSPVEERCGHSFADDYYDDPGDSIDDCEGLLGSFGKDLSGALKIIRIVGPLMVIFLSSYDYAAAIFSKDVDLLKKANSRIRRRLILIAFLFLIPTILDIVLRFADSVYTTSCIR